MAEEDVWRIWINALTGEDLPEDGAEASSLETFPAPTKPAKVFVQKLTTEVYIFTDQEHQLFGERAFQDVRILGEMSPEKLVKILEREKRKREPKEDS